MSEVCLNLSLFELVFGAFGDKKVDLDTRDGFETYCKAIEFFSDEEIIKHYSSYYPNFAIPILRKGTPFSAFSKLYNIELNYVGKIGAVLDDTTFIHFKGPFITLPDSFENRYCFTCVENNITNNSEEVCVSYFHNMHFNDLIAANYIDNHRHEYFCTICDEFLYNVECSDTQSCDDCEPFIQYESHTGIPLQFFQDDINFYYSVPSALFFPL